MSEFKIHTIDTAPPASKDVLSAVKKKYGFIPNLMGEFADAPSALKAYVALSEFLAETSFSPIEQQIVLAAASMANGCEYCVAAHSAGLKMAGLAQDQLDALRAGRPLADGRLEAVRTFTRAVVERRGWIKQAEPIDDQRPGRGHAPGDLGKDRDRHRRNAALLDDALDQSDRLVAHRSDRYQQHRVDVIVVKRCNDLWSRP